MPKKAISWKKNIILLFVCMILSACVTERDVIGETVKSSASVRAENSSRRAISYMDLEQYETAEEILKKSLKESPKHSVLNYTYALLKLRIGETSKADKYFKASIKADANNSQAAHDYGFYLCSQGRVNAGIEMFELAISNPLFQARALSSLRAGECIFKQNKDKAEQYFLSAYEQNSNISVALFRLSELNFSRQKALSARAYYQRYAAVRPDSAASLYLAYKIEVLAGAKNEALVHRTNLLKKFPGSSEAKLVRKKYQK